MNRYINADGFSVRVKEPQRRQMAMRTESLDQLLPHDRQARVLWQSVESLDLSAFDADIQAVDRGRGRGMRSTRESCCACGCWRRWRTSAVPVSSTGCVSGTCRTSALLVILGGGVGGESRPAQHVSQCSP